MTRMHKLYRFSCTTGKCEDCGLIENHSNACHEAAPIRKIEELYDQLDAANLQVGEVTAHRDRLRDMLNDVRGMAFSVAFASKPQEDLAARILRRIEDGIVDKPKYEWAICGWCAGDGKESGKDCPKCQGAGGKTLETEQCESVYPLWNVRCCLPPGHQGRHESKGGDDRTRFMWAIGKPATEPKKDADGRIRHCLEGKDGCTGGAMSCSCVCVNCDAIRNF